MHTRSLRYAAFSFLAAAAAWGAVWLGPAGGWTHVSGASGYIEWPDSPDTVHAAFIYGAAFGLNWDVWSLRARALGYTPSSGIQSYGNAWGGWEEMKLDYRESALEAAAFGRFSSSSSLRLGIAGKWLHTIREDKNFTSGPFPGPIDELNAVGNWVVGDYLIGPAIGYDLDAGRLAWRMEGTVHYWHHREHGEVVSPLYNQNGSSYLAVNEAALYRDSLGIGAELGATVHLTSKFQAEVWAAVSDELMNLGSNRSDAALRRDFVVGITPSVTFL